MGIVDDDRRRGRRRPTENDALEAAAHRLQVMNARLNRLAADVADDGGADRAHPVVEIRLAEKTRLDTDLADRRGELAVQTVHADLESRCGRDVRVAHAKCDHAGAQIGDEAAAVFVVAIYDGRADMHHRED